MPSSIPRSRIPTLFSAALLAVLLVSACGAQPTPVIQVETKLQTVQVTVEVTSEVTSEVTREVTRVVEIPVTVTPSLTLDISLTPSLTPTLTRTPTITRTPSRTPTPEPPVVTVLVHASCLYGPGSAYLWLYGLNATSWMEVIGRTPYNPNTDPKDIWLLVQAVHATEPNPCWVKSELVRFNDGGDATTHPEIPIVTYTNLPWSKLYRQPQGVGAIREGIKVTIYWAAVWMTEDDYRGYLVEAWVCHGGQQYLAPVGYTGVNIANPAVVIPDEPGCSEPSNGRLYTVEKHGYTQWIRVPWPSF
jgi:hypothetical protein